MICLPIPFYPERDLNNVKMKAKLAQGISLLELTKVAFMVVVHKYYDYMQDLTKKPIVNLIDITIHGIANKSANAKILLSAAKAIMEASLYQDKIRIAKISCPHSDNLYNNNYY